MCVCRGGGGVKLVVLGCDPCSIQPVIASLKCHIEKQACVKFFFFFFFLLSHIFTNSHVDSLSFPHILTCTPLHTHTRPHGEWCLHKCPPLFPPPSPPSSHSLSLPPLTRFQTCRLKHTWLHTPPPPQHFPSLPLHFSRAASPWQRGKRPLSLASSVTEWGV